MKHKRGLVIGLALTLAGMLLLSGPVLAQGQGRNRGGGQMMGQGNQLCTGGPGGTCAVNPPNNPGNQSSPGYGAGNAQQQRRGPKGRGGGRFNQPNNQANPPAAGQTN